jgi:hypothetical protein
MRAHAQRRAIFGWSRRVLPRFKHGSVTDWTLGIDKSTAEGHALVQTIVAKQSGRGRYD